MASDSSDSSSEINPVHLNPLNPDREQFEDDFPTGTQSLGWFTVMCLILNRSIGSGIFATPSRIILGTGNVGPSLLMWIFGGLVALSGVNVWNEFGLTVPRRREETTQSDQSVPRSGGEKNYVIRASGPVTNLLTTCMYGIVYLILGNLSGNAIQLGVYFMTALGHDDPSKGSVIGVAIAALTFAVLIHVFSRRGGILINNGFAIFKVSLLIAIIIIGILHRSGVDLGGGAKQTKNFEMPFAGTSTSFANYVDSLLYIFYSYSGFKQPFYAMSECATPRRIFPLVTNIAVAVQWVLFILTNFAYLWAVDLSRLQATTAADYRGSKDIASLFFESVFGTESTTPKRVMTGLLAFSILGNIIVMTFVAARVKQEIAKEGILPFSPFFGKSTRTPWALFKRWHANRSIRRYNQNKPDKPPRTLAVEERGMTDQSPIGALFLHLCSSVFLIIITSPLNVQTAYTFLISIYAYVINGLIGFLCSGGLLYLKYLPADRWRTFCQFKLGPSRWTNSLPAWLYCLFTGFLLIASFVPPTSTSDVQYAAGRSGLPWYVVPVTGMSTLLWGPLWFWGLKRVEHRKGAVLINHRNAELTESRWVRRGEERIEWVMTSEIIDREWVRRGVLIENMPMSQIAAANEPVNEQAINPA